MSVINMDVTSGKKILSHHSCLACTCTHQKITDMVTESKNHIETRGKHVEIVMIVKL